MLLSDEEDNDSDYTPGPVDRLTAQRSVDVTRKIGRTACELARVGIGDEAAARVMTCMCQDMGLGTVITAKKIRDAREAMRVLCFQMLSGIDVEGKYYIHIYYTWWAQKIACLYSVYIGLVCNKKNFDKPRKLQFKFNNKIILQWIQHNRPLPK